MGWRRRKPRIGRTEGVDLTRPTDAVVDGGVAAVVGGAAAGGAGVAGSKLDLGSWRLYWQL